MSSKTIMSLHIHDSVLLVVDYQEKLFPQVFNYVETLGKAKQMIEFAQLVNLPVVISEHYPDGLGRTVKELSSQLEKTDYYHPLPKKAFNCFGDEKIHHTLKKSGKKNILICGIETHICVLQTVLSALKEGFNTFLLVDCVGARERMDHDFALMQADSAGAVLTTVETVIYQMVKHADFPKFKDVIRLIAPKE